MATVAAALLWGPSGFWAAAAGAVLGCANLWFLRWVAARAVARVLDNGSAAGGLGAGLILKMPLLFAALWIAVNVLKLGLAPFALGLSVIVAAPLVVGLRAVAREAV